MKKSKIKFLAILALFSFAFSSTFIYSQELSDEEQQSAKEMAKLEKEAAKQAEKEAKQAKKEQNKARIDEAKLHAKEEKIAEKESRGQEILKPQDDGSVTYTAPNGKTMNFPKVAVVFEEGIAMTNVTRIVDQKGERNNYVFVDNLAGAYFLTKTTGLGVANPVGRVAAFIPLSSTFNSVPISSFDLLSNIKKPAIDGFLGLEFRLNFLDYLFLDIQPGFHAFFQLSDRFNYLDLGLQGRLAFELPIAYEWTIVLAGNASWDLGNFGTNRNIEAYDYVWQLGFDLGVRYTTKSPNVYNYINETEELIQVRRDIKNEAKQEKLEKKAAQKAIRDKEKAEAKALRDKENEEKKAAKQAEKEAKLSQQQELSQGE